MNVDYNTLWSLQGQTESGNRSYDDSGNLITNPKSGAQGLMQVLPTTNRDPGYGVRPAANDTEEERIRVGRDYSKALIEHYGDVNKGLAAYNWGPGNLDKLLLTNPGDWQDHLPAETRKYVGDIGGKYNGNGAAPKFIPAIAASLGKPKFTKAMEQDAVVTQLDIASGATPNAQFESAYPVAPAATQPALYPEDAAREQAYLERTNFTEAMFDSMVNNTVTAGIGRLMQAGEHDPNFDTTAEPQVNAMKQAGIYGIGELADYVVAARNAQDFGERLQLAQERKDFAQRMANTEGWAGASAIAGTLVGGMADPVAIIATMGVGAAVAAARNAAVIGRTAALSRAALGGAAENIALDAAVRETNNQRFSWGNLFEQGVTGGVLGAMGGLLVSGEGRVAGERIDPAHEPVLSATARAAQEVVDGQIERAYTFGSNNFDPRTHVDESVSTEMHDMPDHGIYDGMALTVEERRAVRMDRLERDRAEEQARFAQFMQENVSDPNNVAERRAARDAYVLARQIDEDAAVVRREARERQRATENDTAQPRSNAVIEGANVKSGWAKLAEIEQTSADPLESALAARLRNMLSGDVPIRKLTKEESVKRTGRELQGWYDSSANEVALMPDSQNWHVLHEMAHAATVDNVRYGIANPESKLGALAKEMETLRVRAKTKWDAMNAGKPKKLGEEADAFQQQGQYVDYYMSNVDEFIAGLFSGNKEFIDHLSGMKVGKEDLLTRVVAVVRKVLGLDAGETNAFLKALNLTEQIAKPQSIYPQTPTSLSALTAAQRADLPLNGREARIKGALEAVGEEVSPEQAKAVARANELIRKSQLQEKGKTWLWSPGVALATSKSAIARIAGSILFENSIGNAARRPTVALQYEMMRRGYTDQFLNTIQENMLSAMTAGEKLGYWMGGGRDAVARISSAVAEERLKHRAAVQAGVEYTSTADQRIQAIAKTMDDQIEKMTKDGVKVGNEYAENVRGGGWVGFMPQTWTWEKFSNAYRGDPATWNALKKNFTQQYIEMNVEPALKEAAAKGLTGDELDALRESLTKQVDHQVNTRLAEAIRDPDSRTSMDTSKFETMAADLLTENFRSERVTDDVADQFRKILGEHIRDRSRTEFDLLREVDGKRLLDFVDHDMVTTVTHTAHRFAGQNAMAKAGFKDLSDFEALVTLAQKDGASPDDVANLQFAGRAFGFQPMIAGDHPVLSTLRNFTYAATMGKLGIANLADLMSTVTAVGVRGMFQTLGYAFRKETDLYKTMSNRGAGLLGQDYRIHQMTGDILPNGKALTGVGAGIQRVSQKAAQAVSWISGANTVSRMLHKGFLPVMAEDVVDGLRGKDGGMSTRRLADAGLSGEMAERIRVQLEKHEAGRKEGDAFNWNDWDDQEAADNMIAAFHRVTYATFQRGLIGEAAAWRTESAVGNLFSQFHTFGITSMEKQLGRNVSINDANAYTAMVLGAAWSAFLYYSRVQANMAGMTGEQRREYEKKQLTTAKLVGGTLNYWNMSGIAGDVYGMGEVIFGGNSYQGGSGPVAGVGYLTNGAKALNAVGNMVTGRSKDFSQDAAKVLRIVPGANSVAGTYFSNMAKQ